MKDFEKIYEGSRIAANPLITALEEHKISPVIKDENESARLAGFAPKIIDNIQLFVHKDEVGVAKYVIQSLENV